MTLHALGESLAEAGFEPLTKESMQMEYNAIKSLAIKSCRFDEFSNHTLQNITRKGSFRTKLLVSKFLIIDL